MPPEYEEIWSKWHTSHNPVCPSEDLARFMSKHKGQKLILDLGCGNCVNDLWLYNMGHKVVGVDVVAVDRTVDKSATAYFQTARVDLSKGKLPFKNQKFDIVLDICTLQHLTDDEARGVLSEVRRILKPDGVMFSKLASSETSYREDVSFSPPIWRTKADVRGIYEPILSVVEINKTIRTNSNGTNTIAHWLVETDMRQSNEENDRRED